MEATAGTSPAPAAVVSAAPQQITPATAVLGVVDGVVVAAVATATTPTLAQQARVVVPVETTDRVPTAEPARAVAVAAAAQRFHRLMLVVPARMDTFN